MAGKSSKKRQKVSAPGVVGTRVDEMKEGINQIESLMKEAAGMAASEMQRIDEIVENLGETVARLEAGIREREGMLREKDSTLQELESELTGRIREMENQLKDRDELLQSRAEELKENRSRTQDAVLAAQILNLENQIEEKEKLLESRELEMVDLRSRLEGLEASHEGGVSLREENVVLLEEVEPGLGDGLHPVELIEEAVQGFETGAEPERKSGVIEQSMRGVVIKPMKTARQEGEPDEKKTTLVSLLSPMKKRS